MTDADYRRLLALRTGLRRFARWSEQQAEAAGITSAQHQLLLAIRGHHDRQGPTITEVSEYLLLRHHSAVELVDRAVSAGLVDRASDTADGRVVRLRLTRRGTDVLRRLSTLHLDELDRFASVYESLWEGLEPTKHLPPGARPT